MSRAEEGRILKIAGAAAFAVAALILVGMFTLRGIEVGREALSMGLAMAFVMLSGVTVWTVGGILSALDTGCNAMTAKWMGILAAVCVLSGAIHIGMATVRSWGQVPTLNQIGLGLGGSFILMTAVVLLGGRHVMMSIGAAKAAPVKSMAAGA